MALNWYHLADSAFPTGGYAFSAGLEAAAKLGLFSSMEEFEAYLRSSLAQVAAYEVPFLQACRNDSDSAAVIERYHAGLLSPSMVKASLVQGRSLLRALEQLEGREAIARTLARLPREPDRRHFVLAFGWGMAELGMESEETVRCFLFMNLRDGISAAVRLGSLGPMEGHRLQHRMLGELDDLVSGSAAKGWRDAVRSTPQIDAAQGYHNRIYSKLFQN